MQRFIHTMVSFAALLPSAGAFISTTRGVSLNSSSAKTAARSAAPRARGIAYRPRMAGSGSVTAEKKAVFGGGCFWCTEAVYLKLKGVQKVVSGYAGGTLENPSYKDVCSGQSGHAEVVLVEYDPSVVSYEELLEIFWKSHDPTQGDRQGMDMGSEYRSIILCEDEEQLETARASKEEHQAKVNDGAVLGKMIGAVLGKKKGENIVNVTTTIDLLTVFWEAENYHQNYYAKNPQSPYCVMNVGAKLTKLRPEISRLNRLAGEREQAA